MLVVTTSVRMVDGVHSDTTYSWESLSESLELVEKGSGLHDWLLVSSSTSNDSNGSSAETGNGFSGSWWKSDSGSAAIIWMSNNGCVSSWASGVSSLVSNGGLNVADGCTFWDSVDWKDVTGWDGGLSSAEQVLSWVCSFSSEEIFGVVLVFIWVSEIDFKEGTSSSWVVKDSSDDSLDVSLSFDKIKISISWRSHSFWFGCRIHATDFTLSLA